MEREEKHATLDKALVDKSGPLCLSDLGMSGTITNGIYNVWSIDVRDRDQAKRLLARLLTDAKLMDLGVVRIDEYTESQLEYWSLFDGFTNSGKSGLTFLWLV